MNHGLPVHRQALLVVGDSKTTLQTSWDTTLEF